MKHFFLLLITPFLLVSCLGMSMHKQTANAMKMHRQIMAEGQKVRTSTELKNIEEAMGQKTYLEVDDFTIPQKDESASLFIYDSEKQKQAYCTFNPQAMDTTATGFTNKTTLFDMEDNLLYELTFSVANSTISVEYKNQAGEDGSFTFEVANNTSNMADIVTTYTISNNFFNEPVVLEMNSLTIMRPGAVSVTAINEVIFYYNEQPAAAMVENIEQNAQKVSHDKKIMVDSDFFNSNNETALCLTATIAVLDYISVLLRARQSSQNNSFDNGNDFDSFDNGHDFNSGPSWNNNGTIDNNNNPFDNF